MSRARSFWSLVALLLLVAVAVPTAAIAQSVPTADLAIVRITGPRHANAGQTITFRVVAANLGPDASQLDAIARLPAGLALVGEDCALGVSADTPACEYGNVAPGTYLTTIVTVRVVADGGTVTFAACTGNEGASVDPNGANDCASVDIAVG